ncbi:hypothetical protein LPB140_10845 [Sphingorhabdus lutea]|uniref:Lipoprotein n=1 Tax=Sphingorhabdus lutea TaxID=1913578 RepID=A0A1L3JDI4_9SPHN|nr:hypothetical protein [Sphingorhabdus lutea]APG63201.1 hypothetical protein LPB140_10845 [Sphingorhabdus lutea]
MLNKYHLIALSLSLMAGACVPNAPAPEPAPPTKSQEIKAPPPAPLENRADWPKGEWTDWPISSGNWVYRNDARGSIALFGVPNDDALVTLRCDQQMRKLYFSRQISGAQLGQAGMKMTLRASQGLKQFDALPVGGENTYVAAVINQNDQILDALIYSRGRFAVELTNVKPVAIPAWPELARVVEDCR